jgi:penicillin-binding protein 1C
MNTMARRGWLSGADLAVARAERLALTRPLSTTVAPHFVDHVLADVADAHPRRVETTLDATLQREVQGIIDARRRTLDAHHADDVAVAVLDNQTGEWLAWEGSGRDISSEGGAIDGVTVPRQPGSALKPFTYAAAFERGFDPASVLADVPSQFGTDEPGVLYSPRNYDGQYRGPLLARAALAGSENVPAVVLASDIGVPTIARFLRRAGFSSLGDNAAHYGLGLTLGNAEVRLDEMVAAYAMFARGGEWMKPTAIRAIDGRPIAAASTVRLVSPRTAFWITDILSDNDARAYTFGRGGSLEFTFPVAAKTGTSTAYHDNWAVGYTRDVTVGVWVGNFDRTPLRDSSGVTGAGPIFHAVMLAAVERTHGSTDSSAPILPPVSNVKRVRVCALSGLAAGAACPIRTDEWLPADAPRDQCTWHHASDEGVITVWPEAYRDWARDAGLLVALTSPSAHSLPPTAYSPSGAAPRLPPTAYSPSGAAPRLPPNAYRPPPTAYSLPLAAPRPTASGPLAIVTPLAGAVYLVDPTLRREFQALPLRASGGAPGARQWFVDDSPLGLEKDDALLRWPLAVGEHAFTVRDATGRTATTKIVVK